MLAPIATQAAMVSVFAAAPMFSCRRVEVPALAERFGHGDVHSQMGMIQVFVGTGGTSLWFSLAGLHAGEAIDAKYGYDLKRAADREFVLDYIRRTEPRLVTADPPCPLWGPYIRLNCPTQEGRRELQVVRRRKEAIFLNFAEMIFKEQLAGGACNLGELGDLGDLRGATVAAYRRHARRP